MLIHVVVESDMRRLMPLSCPYSNYETIASG